LIADQRRYAETQRDENREYQAGLLADRTQVATDTATAAWDRGAPQREQTANAASNADRASDLKYETDRNAALIAEYDRNQNAAGQPGIAPEGKVNIPNMNRSGEVVQTQVAAPYTPAFQEAVTFNDGSINVIRDINEMKSLIGEVGTEYTGPKKDRMDALANDMLLKYAQANGMGALAGPDERIALGPIPNPTGFWANVGGVVANTPIGLADALLGAAMGSEGGAFGVTPEDINQGYYNRYDVMVETATRKFTNRIQANPLLLANVSNGDLAMMPRELLMEIEPQLQMQGRTLEEIYNPQ
jgi:hypothetical protein